jgi:hypothetical protein
MFITILEYDHEKGPALGWIAKEGSAEARGQDSTTKSAQLAGNKGVVTTARINL